MAYTDKLRVVYGDYTLGVHGEGFDYIFLMHRVDWNLSLKMDMSGCTVVKTYFLESIDR